MADTPNGETANQGDSPNNGASNSTPPAPPPKDNAVDTAEVERLRKEAEQKELRIRQLENEKTAREKVEEEARQKALEEQNEWKTIAEQEKTKREALEQEREDAVKKIKLEDAKAELLKEFPLEVAEAAADIDLTLSDDSDEAKETFKAKLTKLSERVSSKVKVGPNNQNTNTNEPDRNELLREHAKGNQKAYDDALSGLNWVKHSKAINGEE